MGVAEDRSLEAMGSRKTSRQQRPAALATAARPAVLGSARVILRGDLDKVGLPTLLTIVEMERRTGIFVLSRGRQLGRLHVREGRIVRASTEGSRRLTGEEAVYQMLTWPDGRFELWTAQVSGGDEVGQGTAYLLMEGMRRIDEAAAQRGGRGVPANDIIFAL
jgi:two-component system, OmpR family, response regulator